MPKPDLAALWESFAYYVRCACALFGAPADLAADAWLSQRDYDQASSWLHRCEEALRRLAFLEALALGPPALLQPRPPARRAPARPCALFDEERPETWRVSFRLAPASRLRQGPMRRLRGASMAAPWSVRPALPLARRLESLRRAQGRRALLARAAARLLRRGRACAQALARPLRSYGVNTRPGDLFVADLSALIARALPTGADSS